MGALLERYHAQKKSENAVLETDHSQNSVRRKYLELYTGQSEKARNTLTQYEEKIASGGYMSENNRVAYRKAVTDYMQSGSQARKVAQSMGYTLDEAADQQRQAAEAKLATRAGKWLEDTYGKYETEEDWNQALASAKETEEMLKANTAALAIDIAKQKDELDALYTEQLSVKNTTDHTPDEWADYGAMIIAKEKEIKKKEAYLEDANKLQAIARLESVADPNSENYDPEFEIKSKYDPKPKVELSKFEQTQGFADPWGGWVLYEAINGNTEASDYLVHRGSQYGTFGGALYSKPELGHFSEDEQRVYNYYADNLDQESADQYYALLESDLNARNRLAEAAYWSQYAEESPTSASLFSVAISPLKGLSYVGQVADYIDDGKIDHNDPINSFSYIASDIRGEVSSMIEGDGSFWGKVGSWGYQLGMGMGDFLMSTAVSGGNSTLSLAIMGTGAAADTTIMAKQRGLNDDQAFWLGTIAGAAEILTEKIQIDNLFDLALKGKGPLTYALKNVFGEALEEPTSSLINTIADVIIAGDKSEWAQMVRQYEEKGVKNAKASAFWNYMASLGLDSLGGAVSGGLMAIPGTIGQASAYNRAGNTILKGDALPDLMELAAGLNIPEVNSLVESISKKASAGKVGQLAYAVSEHLPGQMNSLLNTAMGQNKSAKLSRDKTALQQAAQTRLAELGEYKNVPEVAAVLAKQAAGENLSHAEKRLIAKSQYGQQVAGELNSENSRSESAESSWVKSIGTERINAEAYNSALEAESTQQTGTTPANTSTVHSNASDLSLSLRGAEGDAAISGETETAPTTQQILQHAIENMSKKPMDPKSYNALNSYKNQLQHMNTTEALLDQKREALQQQQATGADPSLIQQTQADIAKLEKMLAQQQNKLQTAGQNPALQKVMEQSQKHMQIEEAQVVENSRKNVLDNSAESDTIGTDEANNPDAKAKRRQRLFQNVLNGRIFEDALLEEHKSISKDLETQITIKVGSKKIRVDALGFILDENGNYPLQILELKSSETAPLTANQGELFPILAKEGGVVVGKGKGIFSGGTVIPPGTVIKVIRGKEGGSWYVSDRYE